MADAKPGAIVTGASRGLGRAIALRLAAEGRAVALWGRDVAALDAVAADIAAAGGQALPVIAHVEDEASVAAAMEASVAALGRLHVLVNNAGLIGARGPLEQLALADWQRVFDVNVTGAFLCCRAAIPHLRASGWGRIVNIASVAGKENNPFVSPYVASKAAMLGLTRSLGRELAGTGILVNAVTPSASETAIFGELTEARRAQLLDRVPLKRFVAPEEVAAMVAWLASEQCSFSTGAVFDISGGRATS